MRVKTVTLYSLPYVVSVASILAVAQQVTPPITSLGVSHVTTIQQTISAQIVNRAQKRDRLPIHRVISRDPSPNTVRQIFVEPATG
jgi:hypothetical protein